METKANNVPYIAYEAAMFRMERINRRLTWALLASLAVAVGAVIVAIVK